MKLILTLIPMVFAFTGFAQAITLKTGRSVLPGDYLGIGYEHYTNSAINGKINVHSEKSRVNGLHYSAYGIDLLGEYASNQGERSLFAYRIGLGATGQVESEPWIYGGLPGSKKLNYGVVSELTGEWWMSDQFCLSVFGQQKWLFNSALGRKRFAYGIALKFHLGSN